MIRTILVHDVSSGTKRIENVTDEWVIENLSPYIELTADKTSIAADGVDKSTITIQLLSQLLSDDSRVQIAKDKKVNLLIDDKLHEVEIINGSAIIEIGAVYARTYTIKAESLDSNVLTITAT